MRLFEKFNRKENNQPDFSEIDSTEKAIELANRGTLSPLYLMPLRFNGEASERNRLFVPPVVVELKDRYDDIVEDLLIQEKVNGLISGNFYFKCEICYESNKMKPASRFTCHELGSL